MIVVVLFILSVCSVIGYLVISDVNTDVQADTDMHNISKESLSGVTTQYPTLMDNMFIFFLVLIWVVAIVASFFVDTHPIFLIIAVVLMAGLLFVGAIVSNTYQELAADSELSAAAAGFPKTAWVMNYLVLVIIAIAASIMIAMYGKSRT